MLRIHSQGPSLGGGAIVRSPPMNARLLATVCRGGNAVVLVVKAVTVAWLFVVVAWLAFGVVVEKVVR